MEFLILGVIVALNFIIIKKKLENKRYEDAIFDGGLLALITMIFAGSFGGLIVGTVASLLISIYLYAYPPTFFSGPRGLFSEFKKRAKRRSH